MPVLFGSVSMEWLENSWIIARGFSGREDENTGGGGDKGRVFYLGVGGDLPSKLKDS